MVRLPLPRRKRHGARALSAAASARPQCAGPGAAAQMAAQGSAWEAMDQRLQQAQRFKEDGNQRYKEGRFRDAVSRYHRALLQLRGLDPSVPSPLQAFGREQPPVMPEQERALHSTQTDCYNNLAACLLHMEPVNYERVKEYSLKVLERQPENPKALYRAGVAAYHLRDYDQARHYLMAAISSQPQDAKVKRYLQLTETQLSTYHQKEKQLYMGMFN